MILQLSIALNFIQPSASAEEIEPDPWYPKVLIKLNDQSQTAEVGPGDSGEVKFNGSVILLFPSEFSHPDMIVNVTLYGEDTWNSVEIEPSTMVFTRNEEKYFTVHVRAPNGEFLVNTGTVTVTGRWEMVPQGTKGPADPLGGVWGRIHIEQFYKFSISGLKTSEVSKPGDSVIFKLDIRNEGNFQDAFSIELINEEELDDKYMNVILTQSNIEIQPNSTKTIKINVNVGYGVRSLGKHEIKLRISSEKGIKEGLESEEFTFEVDVPQNTIIYTSDFSNAVIIIFLIIIVLLFIFWRRRSKKRRNRKAPVKKKLKHK